MRWRSYYFLNNHNNDHYNFHGISSSEYKLPESTLLLHSLDESWLLHLVVSAGIHGTVLPASLQCLQRIFGVYHMEHAILQ